MNTIRCNKQLVTPSKIVCIGRNYVAHAKELGNAVPAEPVVFIKPNSAISESLYAGEGEPNHYEGELCFLLKDGQISAVGFGLDLTKRATQTKLKQAGLPWERAKSFDGAAVFSEFVSIDKDDIAALSLRLEIDGECRQAGGVDLMLFKPDALIQELKRFLTLEDGDIIMTGTPEGVGEVKAGARFTAQVLKHQQILVSGEWIAK